MGVIGDAGDDRGGTEGNVVLLRLCPSFALGVGIELAEAGKGDAVDAVELRVLSVL